MNPSMCQRCNSRPKGHARKAYCDTCAAAVEHLTRQVHNRELIARRRAVRLKRNQNRACSECGHLIPPEFPRHRMTCTEECRTTRNRRIKRDYKARAPVARQPKECTICQAVFTPRNSRQITCSSVCSAERNRNYARQYQAELRQAERTPERRIMRRPQPTRPPEDGYNAVQVYHRLRRTNPQLAESYLRSLNAHRRHAGQKEVPA